jgi:hypothetical protein
MEKLQVQQEQQEKLVISAAGGYMGGRRERGERFGEGRVEYSMWKRERLGGVRYLTVFFLETDWEGCYRLIDLVISMVGPLCVFWDLQDTL